MSNDSIRSIAMFHRVFAVFPLILGMLLLASCTGTGNSPWKGNTGDAAVYGSVPVAGAAPVASNGQTVKVAILLPLSGKSAGVGQSMLQAAQLAVFDMGYDNFELMSLDTGGTANGASAAATKAVTDGAQLILGPLFAEEVRAVKSVTSMRNINVIAFSTDWTLAGGNTYIMGFLPFGQVERIASFAADMGLKKVAVAAPADQYGTTVSQRFESEAAERGITVTRALSDVAGYDSVFIPAGGNQLTSILQRVSNTNARKLGTGLWDDERVAAMPQMNGAWFAAPSPAARASFESRYQSTYGSKPVRIATLAYDASALAQALSKNGGGASAFTAANLTNPNGFAGIDGILRFNRSNLVERGMAVLEIKGGRMTEIAPAPRSF